MGEILSEDTIETVEELEELARDVAKVVWAVVALGLVALFWWLA